MKKSLHERLWEKVELGPELAIDNDENGVMTDDLFPELESDKKQTEGLWDAKYHYRRDGLETSKAAAKQAKPNALAHEGRIVAAF